MGQKFTSDSPSIEEILRLKNKHTISVDILIDAELAADIKTLERQHMIEMRADNKQNRTPKAPALLKQIEKLQEMALESTITFTFQDLGRKRFEDLWKTCPPTDEQREEGYNWDPDEFGPVILASSCIAAGSSETLTLDEAKTLYNEWSTAEAEMLVMTAINANMGAAAVPFTGTATDDLSSSGLSLITAPIEESPTPTS